ncbi:MAG TPA: mycothiol system anti-sigma-R factor [Mycobacterium sp.]|nr:mycothiol system anti-sigma-R factor [Mycobacterium sp.]
MTEHSGGCGSPNAEESPLGVDCAQVIAEVWTLLDGECTPDDKAKLRSHLENCPECLRHYGVEEQIKALIARKCGGDKAPQHLLERVRLQISRTTIFRG